ncbi:hypothetical protein [Mucilaginibacter flavidus]|nr:hypothetical protein [Mucilaginibacter flavidus]MCO5949839.1 hypothetical protein [Mucilaginibacter flavidus]
MKGEKQRPACRRARKIGWYSAAVRADLASVGSTAGWRLLSCLRFGQR